MTVEAVCFDLDDTLYPYNDYARAGFRNAADKLAMITDVQLHEELLALYFEEDVSDGTFDTLLDRHDLSTDLTPALVDAYHEAIGPLEPYADTETALRRVGETHRLGLVTDGHNGYAKLEALGLKHHFDGIVVNPPLEISKQEREPFDRVAAELAIEPSEMVYVGDDPRSDFAVPNRLGAGTVRLRRGRYTDISPPSDTAVPDTEIDRLAELPATLGNNGW